MYIQTKKYAIQLVRKNSKLFAPVDIRGITVLLQFYSGKGEKTSLKTRTGNLPPFSNNLVFEESIKRIEYLIDYIKLEKIELLASLPIRINGIDYMDEERKTAMIITRKTRRN